MRNLQISDDFRRQVKHLLGGILSMFSEDPATHPMRLTQTMTRLGSPSHCMEFRGTYHLFFPEANGFKAYRNVEFKADLWHK